MAQSEQTELPLRSWLMILTLMPISWSQAYPSLVMIMDSLVSFFGN